jgi:very-short-patch-repair endonuclease
MPDAIDEIDRIVGRLDSSMRGTWQACLYGTVEELNSVCESPIEVMLASALLVGSLLADGATKRGSPFIQVQKQADVDMSAAMIVLVPQYSWNKYRIDFALFSEKVDLPIFVECDGHDFHERTKEQAARDRSKDRAIQSAGYTVLRFTGSEIYRAPERCALQIIDVLANKRRIP